MNPDRLAELEEERRFLLRSLADLEREHVAGDVDEVDYHALKDGYTVRAAATMRAIETGRSSLPARPAVNWPKRVASVAVVVALIGVVWWVLAASSAERTPGQTVTGLDPRDEVQQLLAEARLVSQQSPGAAVAAYADVLEVEPDNPEALAYFGWTLALDARQRGDELGPDSVATRLAQSVEMLSRAVEVDPGYVDPKCFLGVVEFRFRDDAEAAAPWVEECLTSNPPADVRALVQNLADEIESVTSGA